MKRGPLIVALTMLVGGCIPLPIPTRPMEPRYSSVQLDAVGRDARSRDTIAADLGRPDLQREDGRFWIYKWKVDRGRWIAIPLAPLVAGDIGPISSDQFLLVLEFDAGGMLLRKEFAQESNGGVETRYCTEGGLCIEHRVVTGIAAGGLIETDFHNDFSAVTVRGQMREHIARVQPRADECLLMIWPDEVWTQSGGLFSDPAPGGLAVGVKTEGTSSSLNYPWIPAGAVARIVLPAGTQVVAAVNPRLAEDITEPRLWGSDYLDTSSAKFECRAQQLIYLAIGAATREGNRFPIVLRSVDATAARTLIANKAEVLLPTNGR